jgi:hypothetical protein
VKIQNLSLHFLISFVSLCLFISSAADASCTPVVYAFRHAEDFKEKSALTPVGEAHADLYPEMVANFESAHDYCPVGFVYSMYDVKPDGQPGTINPRDTAEFLAIVACYNLALFTNSSPAITCAGDGFKPRTALANGRKLYEYLGATGPEQTANSATAAQLRNELINRTQAGGGLSSAIFWTSQGLNVLGQAIVPGFTGIPGCSVPPPPTCEKPKPPRNAVYVFEYTGSFPPSDNSAFIPPTNVTQYLQCFNIDIEQPMGPPMGKNYYAEKDLTVRGIYRK